MKLGLVFACLRLQLDPEQLVNDKRYIHIIADGILDPYIGVNINGVVFQAHGVVQCFACLVFGYIAFNLKHCTTHEDLVELVECLTFLRKAATKAKVRSLFAAL
jgi:hypothetical protein